MGLFAKFRFASLPPALDAASPRRAVIQSARALAYALVLSVGGALLSLSAPRLSPAALNRSPISPTK